MSELRGFVKFAVLKREQRFASECCARVAKSPKHEGALWAIVFVPCFESFGQFLTLLLNKLNLNRQNFHFVQVFLRTLGALFDVHHDLCLLSKALFPVVCFAGSGPG